MIFTLLLETVDILGIKTAECCGPPTAIAAVLVQIVANVPSHLGYRVEIYLVVPTAIVVDSALALSIRNRSTEEERRKELHDGITKKKYYRFLERF